MKDTLMLLWLGIVLVTAALLGPQAYENPQLRITFIVVCLLSIAVSVVPALMKLLRKR
ncbi:MAG TPA: hypothetical protein VNG51_01410 [Ktedonobacteraceae bacterium]|nr:hypothetical protein [Ktedonobacteraceae bacterium]